MDKETELKIQQALSPNPKYEGMYFSGQKKQGKQKHKAKVSDKQRKIDHLSSRQKYELIQLHKELDSVLVANSRITRSGIPTKTTKKDARKSNGKLGAEGIWSNATFERYKKSCRTFLKYCYEHYGTKRLRDVKPRMVGAYIEYLISKGCSAKTVSSYVSSIRKMAESSVKAGIISHKNLVNEKHRSMVPVARKADRRRGSNGGVGYSVREAKIIIKQAEKHFSLYEQTLLEIFAYSLPRLAEALKISFDQIDYENKCILLTKKNQNKGNRPRQIPLHDSTIEKLELLESFFPNKQAKIWGHRMSEKQVRSLIKECCRLGHVGYKGVHDLRKAAVEWHMKRMTHDPKWTKERIVTEIMRFVDADSKLNPLVRRNGILKLKYVPAELLQRQKRWLVNQYLSQLLGHSRQDASCPYKRG